MTEMKLIMVLMGDDDGGDGDDDDDDDDFGCNYEHNVEGEDHEADEFDAANDN